MNDLYQVRKADDDSNIIPMINVVFLLLIFFMIAGQIRQVASNDLVLPSVKSEKPAALNGIRVEMDRDNQLWLEGEAVTLDQLQAKVSQMDDTLEIALLIDESVTARHFDPLLEVFRKAGKAKVVLIAQSEPSASEQDLEQGAERANSSQLTESSSLRGTAL